MTIIVVLATQRCGSTLFSEDLASLGGLGRPWESFRDLIPPKDSNQGLPIDGFIRALASGYDQRGVCGVTLMGDYLPKLGRAILPESERPGRAGFDYGIAFLERLAKLFGGAVFFHVFRTSLIDQAISRYMAQKTGRYHVDNGQEVYDREEARRRSNAEVLASFNPYDLLRIARRISEEKVFLRSLAGFFGDKTLHVDYESLVSEPEKMAQRVIEHAGLPVDATTFTRRKSKVVDPSDANWIKEQVAVFLGMDPSGDLDSVLAKRLLVWKSMEMEASKLGDERRALEEALRKAQSERDELRQRLEALQAGA